MVATRIIFAQKSLVVGFIQVAMNRYLNPKLLDEHNAYRDRNGSRQHSEILHPHDERLASVSM